MIYEYAISPSLFKDPDKVMYWRATLGKDKGRLISDIPKKKWLRTAYEEINNSGHQPVARKSLKERTRKIFEASKYIRTEQPNPDLDEWFKNSCAAHDVRPFRAIIVEGSNYENDSVLPKDLDLDDHDLWKNPNSIRVNRSAAEMIGSVHSMLECANELILIDRNFKPEESRFRNVLAKILRDLHTSPYGPIINTIYYQVGDRLSENELERLCRRHILPMIPEGKKVSFCIRPWDDLHDRFILTNIGGVSFSVGLDENLGGGVPEVRIVRLNDEDYKKELHTAKAAPVAFTLSGQH